MSEFTGYDPEQEDRDFIASLTGAEDVVRLVGSYVEQSLDPRKLIRVENQARMGSCAGHSLSSNLEWLYCIATQGQIIQLSRMAAYILAQDVNNITTDSGSVVSSGVKVARETGLPEESLWPYPASYTRTKPNNNWRENASKYKIARAVNITTWEQWRTWLGSGQGGIHTGISWGNSMNKAIIESFVPGGGGHSVAALCLSERKDHNGEPYSWIKNSWSESFGSREYPGWHEWSPTAVKQMLQHRFTSFVGLSDMPNVKPREFTMDDLKKLLRVRVNQ
jgi:hypothetical protein